VECYGRRGETARIHYPVAALYHAGLWEIDFGLGEVPNAHGSTVPQRWFDERRPKSGFVVSVYDLVRNSGDTQAAAVRALVEKYFIDAPHTPLLTELRLLDSPAERGFSNLAAEYLRLCGRADVFWANQRDNRASRTSDVPIRSQAARRAVILRSRGRCENPDCGGDIQDVNDRGQPLLDVDHIQDLARDGEDDPAQMIALCPNCHRIKTHGRARERLRAALLKVARQRHQDLLTQS
jgi:5-methylcytosine-specific restriction protein A